MKKLKKYCLKKALAKRAARDKKMILLGTLIGAALGYGVKSLLGKLKCRKCVKRMLAEKR